MKSLVEQVNESMMRVNEKALCDLIPDYDEDADNREDVAHALDTYIEAIENVKPAQLKKVKDWSKFDDATLADYITICAAIAGWCWGVQSLADDDADEASTFSSYMLSIPDGEDWMGFDNVVDNLLGDGELKNIEDEEDVVDAVKDVCAHFNELSKVVNKKVWA
jgi:hypothetical protein